MPQGIVRVRHHLTGKRPPGIAFELTERELAAIGEVTVQWAYLEDQIFEMTLALAEALGAASPDKAPHFSFSRRLGYLKDLLKTAVCTDEEFRQGQFRLIHRIERLAVDRHRVTHGLWDWDGDPYTPIVSSRKPKHEFTERFDFEKLVRLIERISEINFELTFPDGVSDEDRPQSYMSRQAAAAFAGDAELSPLIDPNAPRRRRRRSSAKSDDRSSQ
jgi:hypothetical protein